MSTGMKWVVLVAGLLIVSMGLSLLRNAMGLDESLLVSVITGGAIGYGFVVAARKMGVLGGAKE